MATASKTVSWAFATRITTLATNTTLATATRHDFAAITIDMPEPTRTIRSVRLRVTSRDTATATTGINSWRLGIKLAAVAFDDVDYTATGGGTNGHETLIMERDVTAYFVTNFGSGASQTCQVGVAISQTAASNVNNLTAELWITYDYDNTAATHVKTVEIPIQGHYTTLTTSDIEVGCTGGVSDAPANQIPNLSTFCPEASKTFKQVYLRITAHDFSGGAGDTQLSLKLDTGGTYAARALNKQAIGVGAQYRDIVDLTAAPHSIATNAVHALIAKSNIATTTFGTLSAVLVVTYTFTASGTTRELHSCRAVVANDRGASGFTYGLVAADANQYAVQLEVQEPGTVTLLQSGVVVFDQNQVAMSAYVNAIGQGVRAMNVAGMVFGNPSCAGTRVYVRRCDHDSSAWTLVRGTNRLALNVSVSVQFVPSMEFSGYAIVNYTADIPARGIGSGNRSCGYGLISHTANTSFAVYATAVERTPSFPSSPWALSSAWCDLGVRTPGAAGTGLFSVQAERQPGEDVGDGWYQDDFGAAGGNLAGGTALSRRETIRPITQWLRRSSFGRVGMDLAVSRRWRLLCSAGGSSPMQWMANQWHTLHDISFTVAGTVTVAGAAAANGGAVRIYADDGVTTEYITSVTIAGGAGAFTVDVCDSTRSYFATYNDGTNKGWSGFGTPGTSTFDIGVEVFTASDRTLLTTLATDYTTARAANLDAPISSRASVTALATVQADTDNIQTRLPAALVGGRMPADVGSWLGSAVATPSVAGVPKVEEATLEARLTSSRTANLDNLDVASSTLATSIAALPTTASIAAVKADTAGLVTAVAALPTTPALDALATSIGELPTTPEIAAEIFDFVMNAGAPVGSRTFAEQWRIRHGILAGNASGLTPPDTATTETFRSAEDTKDVWTGTVATDGTRTVGTTDGTP